jgi:hypothetical protein
MYSYVTADARSMKGGGHPTRRGLIGLSRCQDTDVEGHTSMRSTWIQASTRYDLLRTPYHRPASSHLVHLHHASRNPLPEPNDGDYDPTLRLLASSLQVSSPACAVSVYRHVVLVTARLSFA